MTVLESGRGVPVGVEVEFLNLPGLEGWTVSRTEQIAATPVVSPWDDGHGTSGGRVEGPLGRLLIRTRYAAGALVDLERQAVLVFPEVDDAMEDQWLSDQLAPRLLSHLGHFVLHGGGVEVGAGRAILIVAPSGYGKSTLTGYLHDTGWPLLGDDAILLRAEREHVVLRSIYRRLKLRPDSWQHLFEGRDGSAAPGRKVSLSVPEGAGRAIHPRLIAMFVLWPPSLSSAPSAAPIAAAAACMALVGNSFALDPTDRAQAARRLTQASAVANTVPAFRLSYPRDYALLPRIRDLIAATLAGLPPHEGLEP